MSVERLGNTLKPGCFGPECFIPDPHYHQHWIFWPDAAQPQEDQ